MQKSPRTLKTVLIGEELSFTLKGVKELKTSSLCDHCAYSESFEKFEECWVDRNSSGSLNKMGIVQDITHCAMHQPVISFQAPFIGFESDFNTIRPGMAWSSRLTKGNIVGLLNAKNDELFGKAQVVSVDVGNIHDMLAKHAANNHLMLSQEADQQSKLMTVLSKIYGPRIINDQSTVSVINLKRL